MKINAQNVKITKYNKCDLNFKTNCWFEVTKFLLTGRAKNYC